jgi:hypothetical protein
LSPGSRSPPRGKRSFADRDDVVESRAGETGFASGALHPVERERRMLSDADDPTEVVEFFPEPLRHSLGHT